MKNISFEKFKKQEKYFRNYLAEKSNYYYDVNSLHAKFFIYDKKYTPVDIQKKWDHFLKANKGGKILENIDLYIHIPYCRSICSYCTYLSWSLKKSETLDEYIDYLIDNMKFFRKTFKSVTFRCLAIGGGTPNLLSYEQMDRLLSALFENFKFKEEAVMTCEFCPLLAESSKLDLLKKFGFNRISFGVQSLNQETLAANNRGFQRYKEIEGMVKFARKAGMSDVNVDLIAGFATDTPDDFVQSFIKVAKLQPSSIMMISLNPPSSEYLRKHFGLNHREYYQKYYPKNMRAIFKKVIPAAKKLGYYLTSSNLEDYHWKFHNIKEYPKSAKDTGGNPLKGKIRYTGEFPSHAPASCTFGFGIFSRSQIYASLKYRQVNHLGQFSPKKKIFVGRELTKNDEMLKFILVSLERKSSIDLELFRKIFGREVSAIYPYTVSTLREFKKARVGSKFIKFNLKKPEDKYIYALFFVYEALAFKKKGV
jgi:oxygen-independent coproporphyrinogen III oxidase